MEQVVLNNNGVSEEIFVKRGIDGWRIVYPIKHPVYKDIIWKNLIAGGSYWNLLKIGLLVSAILLSVVIYNHDITTALNSCKPFTINP